MKRDKIIKIESKEPKAMYTCICMYVCMYVCMYLYVCLYVQYVGVCMFTYVCIYVNYISKLQVLKIKN